jgi:ElaB/YqjD/DUF883 family membrane-anchored ribosome-binding protein
MEGAMNYQEQQEAIKQKVAGTVNDVAGHMSNLADKARTEGAATKRNLSTTASDLANRATDALNDAGLDTESLSNALRSSLQAISKSLGAVVRDRPLGALAVTAVIGLVIGAMSSR